ncbi:MAG: FAD-binding oxidoreductase, partial [Rhodobacteraceae bacterium]|nr:FAD-binding oxidoreductase [Paracoccaceae bacterium]
QGARLILGVPVTGILTRNGAASGVRTAEGAIAADCVVIAAGTGAPALLGPLGMTLPMLHRPALILRTNPLPPRLSHILVTPALELRQEADGRILAPTSAGHQGDSSDRLSDTPEALAADALARLRSILPGIELDWQETLRAERPMPGDGLPVVGSTSLPGLYLSVMHSGATLGPLIGSLVSRELLLGRAEPMLAPYRPDRFARDSIDQL